MKMVNLLSALSLAILSVDAAADRPWMEDAGTPAEMEAAAQSSEPMPTQPAPAMPQSETVTSGDVMDVPAEIQPGETIPVTLLDFPRRGMSMSRVKNELGEPLTISPTVGQPPITTWGYQDRKVFFEGDLVIHVVAN